MFEYIVFEIVNWLIYIRINYIIKLLVYLLELKNWLNLSKLAFTYYIWELIYLLHDYFVVIYLAVQIILLLNVD